MLILFGLLGNLLVCLRGCCIPTEPWFEDGVRREVCFFPWMEDKGEIINRTCSPLLSHMLSWHSVALQTQETSGLGLACSQRASLHLQMAGVTGDALVPCVFAKLLLAPHTGLTLVCHTPMLTGVGRVHPLIVPCLAVGSPPSICDGLMTESTAHGIQEFVPMLAP